MRRKPGLNARNGALAALLANMIKSSLDVACRFMKRSVALVTA
jgi:hypothetical protein